MTPLMFAVKENRTSFVDRMIDLGCDVTARNNTRSIDSYVKVRARPIFGGLIASNKVFVVSSPALPGRPVSYITHVPKAGQGSTETRSTAIQFVFLNLTQL
ncbi:hypothetical protein J6590_018467 [Homalodisca vitripennis]|nr:hypothetical protein J6590_018467 [Homalodisca vitripennis]